MSIYHVFYNSNKDIAWSTTAPVTAQIIQEQFDSHGYSYIEVDYPETPVGENYYINEAEDDIVEKSSFSPSFSDTNPEIDDVITVTGLFEGTEVLLDGVSAGTMEDTTLTFTATEAGTFMIKLKKDKYYDYVQYITVKRYGE